MLYCHSALWFESSFLQIARFCLFSSVHLLFTSCLLNVDKAVFHQALAVWWSARCGHQGHILAAVVPVDNRDAQWGEAAR